MAAAIRCLIVAAVLVLPVGTAAVAQQLPASLVGWEVRGTLRGTEAAFENHLWRFHPDGRLSGALTAQILTSLSGGGGSRFIEDTDAGRWQVADGRLCIQWRRWYRGEPMCWRLRPLTGRWVRFEAATPHAPSFKGTLARR